MDDRPNGPGKYTFKDGNFDLNEDLHTVNVEVHQSSFDIQQGTTFEGQYQDGRRKDGTEGVLTLANGNRFAGIFVGGK